VWEGVGVGVCVVRFGMGILFNRGNVFSWDSTPYPDPDLEKNK